MEIYPCVTPACGGGCGCGACTCGGDTCTCCWGVGGCCGGELTCVGSDFGGPVVRGCAWRGFLIFCCWTYGVFCSCRLLSFATNIPIFARRNFRLKTRSASSTVANLILVGCTFPCWSLPIFSNEISVSDIVKAPCSVSICRISSRVLCLHP